jgi:hypothetical protein
MKKTASLLALLLCSFLSYAQSVTFGREYPIWGQWSLNNFQQTNDGGYILATDAMHEIDTAEVPLARGYLVKMDLLGQTQWMKSYPKTSGTSACCWDANSVVQTADGGYIIGASTYTTVGPFASTSVILLVKTDNLGNLLWSKTYKGLGESACYCIRQTGDQGYIVCGSTHNVIDYVERIYLLKTDSSGVPQWGKAYAEAAGPSNGAYSVDQTADGGYIVAGDSYSGAFVIKTDHSGTIAWYNNFGMSGDALRSIKPTSDGGYIAAGGLYNPPVSTLSKFAANGTIQWQKQYSQSTPFVAYNGIGVEEVSDGFVMLEDVNGSYNAELLKTDLSGNVQWAKQYPKGQTHLPTALHRTTDGGFAFSCIWIDAFMPNNGVGIFKTDSLGFMNCSEINFTRHDTLYSPPFIYPGFTSTNATPSQNHPLVFTNVNMNDSIFCTGGKVVQAINDIAMQNAVSVFPNPASDNLFVEINAWKGNSIHIQVYDAPGKLLMEKTRDNVPGNFRESLDISALVNGIYFISVRMDDGSTIVKKFIKSN